MRKKNQNARKGSTMRSLFKELGEEKDLDRATRKKLGSGISRNKLKQAARRFKAQSNLRIAITHLKEAERFKASSLRNIEVKKGMGPKPKSLKNSAKWKLSEVVIKGFTMRDDGVMALEVAWWTKEGYYGLIQIRQDRRFPDGLFIDSETLPRAFVKRVFARFVDLARFK